MRPLTAADILAIWERGHAQGRIGRALTILEAAAPARAWGELVDLPVGRQDLALLDLHNRTFGSPLEAVADCPACGEALECALDGDAVAGSLAVDPALGPGREARLTVDGVTLSYRLPSYVDLAAAAECGGVEAARALLVARCVLAAARDGEAIEPAALPAAVVGAVAVAMAEADRAAVIDLDLVCPSCGHGWQAPLDVAAFLWTKLAAAARRLLFEVDALARAYGWREAEILAMSAARRQCYLDLVT